MPVVSFDYIEQHEKMAEEITRLRAENAALATWQCEFTDGKTGLVYAEGGGTYCAMAKEVDRLRAALRGVLWMAEEWYDHGGNEDTLADDYKPALAEARAALGEKA